MSNSNSEHNWTQHLFNIAPVALALVRNRILLKVNNRFCELLGYSRNELVGQNTRICYADENEFERAGQQLYEQISKTGQANVEARAKRKDGTIIDVLISTSIFDKSDRDSEFAFAVIDITDRKKAKEKLKNEKEFTERAINAQIDTLFIFDPSTGKPIRWNDAFSRLSGYSNKEIASMKAPDDLYDKKDLEKATNFLDTISKDGQATVELSLITKDGRRILTEYRASYIMDDEGNPKYVIAIGRDITQRRQIEKKLVSEQYFSESIIQTSPAYFVAIDAEGKTKIMNQTMLKALGYSSEEVIGTDYITTFVPEEDRQKLADIFARLINFNKQTVNENRFLTKDGRELLVEWHGQPVYDADGRFDFFFGVGIDITERKAAENKLLESENKLRSITENAVDFIFIKDKARRYTFINKAMQKMLGLPDKEILGKTPEEIYGLEQGQIIKKVDNRTFSGETVNETRRLVIDDKEFFFNTIQTPLSVVNGKVTSIMGIVRDISKRKLAEEEVRKFKTISDRANIGTAIVDLEGNIIYINECFASMHGLTIEETIGKHLSIFHTDEQIPEVNRINEGLIKDGSYTNVEVWHKRKDGSIFPTMMNSTIINDENNKPLYISASAIDISERKQAEEALRRSEAYLKSLFRAAPIGIGVVADRIIKQVNKRMCEMIGYSQEELIGKSARMLYLSDEDYEYVGREKYAQINDHGTGTVETRWLCKDGRVIDVLLSSAPLDINDLSNDITFTALDITDRKRAEEAQRESERKYRMLVENQIDLIVKVDTKGRFQFVSPSYCRLFGKSDDELLGKTFMPLVHEDDRESTARAMEKLYQPPHTAYMEQRAMTADGWRWLGWMDTALLDNKGNVTAIIGVGRDITKRRQAEEALNKSRAYADNLIKTANTMIIGLDAEGNIQLFNQAAEKITGYNKKELGGKNWFETLVPTKKYPQVYEIFSRLQNGKLPRLFENPILTKSGEERIITWSNNELRDDNKIIGTISFGIDITDRKQAEKALQERERMLDALINAPTESAILIDTKGKILAINRIGAQRLGKKEDEIIGMGIYDFLPPKLAKSRKTKAERVIRTGQPIRFQDELNGRYFDSNIYPVFDDKNKVSALAIYSRDVTRHRQAEIMMRSLVEGTAKATGRDFFDKLVQHLATALNCRFAIIGVLDDSKPRQIKTLSYWNKNKIGENFTFEIIGTPCENVDKRNVWFYQSQASKSFPKDKWLAKNKIEADLGIPLLNPKGKPIGILAVMDTRKFSDDLIDGAHSLMAIFASRAAAELERINAEDEQLAIADRLRNEQKALFDKHVALKQILEHMETEKLDFRHQISSSMERALMPFVKKLHKKNGVLSKKDMEQFEDTIKSITGTEIDDFRANYAKLTSREMDICDLIKKGQSSQEIADKLHLSLQTIQKHRSSIRKKLQLKNKEINLPAYLRYK